MPVRGDEVADRIEGRIREAVDRMMGEIHTSIQDVRKAIEQQLDAAVQSVQADVKSFAFRGPLEDGIRELEESLTGGGPQTPSRPDSGALRTAIQAIESGKNQVEILTALLEQCLHYGSRSALMILKEDTFTGWKAAGFSAHGGNDEQMKRFAANRDGAPQFDTLLSEERSIEWDGRNLAERFGVTPSSRALLIPMVIKDKVAAAVYVDATPEDAGGFDRPTLELLVFTTGLLIDTLTIRKKIPSPSLSSVADESTSRVDSSVPQPEEPAAKTQIEPEFSPEETVAIRNPNFTPGAPPAEAAPPPPAPAEPAPDVPDEVPAAEGFTTPSRTFEIDTRSPERQSSDETPGEPNQYSTSMFRKMQPESVPEPAPSPDPGPAENAAAPESPAERPSTQYVPPPGIERGTAFTGRNSDERRHDEAKRFARLLVSEIKLYNESKVEQGRRDRDIYERLKEDIDRSRQMYDDRVPEDVRNGTNYFYDELVRILADGDRDSLGL